MEEMRPYTNGALAQLLQLGLNRWGNQGLKTDGVLGSKTKNILIRFQKTYGLKPDGIPGSKTLEKMTPYFTGFAQHTLRRGDSFYKIAKAYGTGINAIKTANPNMNPQNLKIGNKIIVPLGFPVIPEGISIGSTALSYFIQGLAARYPFLVFSDMGTSVMGKPLHTLELGRGENTVFYSAAHHANEWITTPLLLRFAEELCLAYARGGKIFGIPAASIFKLSKIYIAPCINPDGVDLVVGELNSGSEFENALEISKSYPQIPFPEGWKANILGTDLNLQYPANWKTAREIKYKQGFNKPAPRDFVGSAPLSQPEAAAVYSFTKSIEPNLILAYHTQGEVIYWKYLDFEPPMSREISLRFCEVSGYAGDETPYASGFAGFKDWFIEKYNKPGYTIEAGLGASPLPVSMLPDIYKDNIGILTEGTILTA